MAKAPLTTAERQELWRQRKAQQAEAWRAALERILHVKTIREARALAKEGLDARSETRAESTKWSGSRKDT